MTSTWTEYYKEESLRKGSKINKMASAQYNQFETLTLEARDQGAVRFQNYIKETDGYNILLLPTSGKCVQIIHSVLVANHPDVANKRMCFGIAGLDKHSPFLQLHEKSTVKPIGKSRTIETREGEVTYPSPKDFTSVTSTEDFKSLSGTKTLPSTGDSRLDLLPCYTHFHPYLLVRTFHGGRTMPAHELGCNIIHTCITGYGRQDKPNRDGVTQALADCYDLLLFLWAVEKGFTSPIKIGMFPHSESIERLMDEAKGRLETWAKNKDPPKSLPSQDRTESSRRDRELSSDVDDVHSLEPDPRNDSKERGRRSEAPPEEEHRTRSLSPRASRRAPRRGSLEDEVEDTITRTERREGQTGRRSPSPRGRSLDRPRRAELPIHSRARSRLRESHRPNLRPLIDDNERRLDRRVTHRPRSPEPRRTVTYGYEPRRVHERDHSRQPSRDRSRNRSPRRNDEDERRRINYREERRRTRQGGQGGHPDDDSDDSDDDNRRGRGGGRRGDDRDPFRNRRRSPSRSDDEGERQNRRSSERRRERRGRDDRRDRSRSRDHRDGSRGRRDDYREGHRRGGSRSRSPEVDTNALLVQCMLQLTKSTQDAKQREEAKRSMLTKLHSEAAWNFRFLSMQTFQDEEPQLNKFVEKLMEDRDLNKALGYVMAATADWPGQVSRRGMTEFLTQGYRAHDINREPGGFTVFMCGPSSTKHTRSEEERKMALKSAFGDIKLDDAALKYYSKKERILPDNIYEAEEQLETTVCLLELLTTKDGEAVQGYLFGLRFLRDNREMFKNLLKSDPLLLVKYLYMLDRVFQKFVKDLSKFYLRSNPIRAAKIDLQGTMVRAIEDMMRGFEFGSIPSLVLPHSLSTTHNSHSGVGGGGGPKSGTKEKDNDKDKPGGRKKDDSNPGWWSKNPSPVEGWLLPAGKAYKDYFSSKVKAHEANIKGWPKLPHHSMSGRLKPMCIRYQCDRECKPGCVMAHVEESEIPKEAHEEITKKFRNIYHYLKTQNTDHQSGTRSSRTFNPLLREPSPDPFDTRALGFNTFDGSEEDESEVEEQKRIERKENSHSTELKERKGPRPKEERDTHLYKRKDAETKRKVVRHESLPTIDPKRAKYETQYSDTEDESEVDSDDDLGSLEGLEIPRGLSRKERQALDRNINRVRKANAKDKNTMSKYLPDDMSVIFDEVVKGADDSFKPPPWLIKAVAEVAAAEVPTPSTPEVRFDTTKDALDHNSALLRECEFDIEKFLLSQAGTTLDYGSEFRPTEQLKKVLGNHPNYLFFEDILNNGMQYHFTKPLSEEERKKEIDEQINRGNHRSAQDEEETAKSLLYKDVTHGFAMPVHADIVRDIKGAMVEPCGVAHQFKLQSDGSRKLAARLTHDLTYSITKDDASVNKRINMEMYVEMIYGWCLTRVIHYIVALQIAYPNQRILIAKYDYSDAYRRVAHAATAAAQTILIVANVAYIMLRLAFGGSPNPPTWCAFSEMVTDLSNEIDLCDDWDHKSLRSPAQPETPVPQMLDDSIPFAQGKPLAVEVPVTCTARTDSFIDDLIRVFLDTILNRERATHLVPLAIHVTSRPHAGESEPIKRRDLLSAPKLEAEGIPMEIQIVLGWDLDTRRLLVLLPQDKFIAWSCDLEEVIRARKVSFGDLESLVGRLNHVAYLLPLARHFLHRLRLKTKNRRHQNQILTLAKEEIEDLLLWGEYLLRARQGISMNRLTFRSPSRVGAGDSCPYGLGGYSFKGRAWRLRIPKESAIYGISEMNNVLEFLALGITLWIMLLECEEEGLHDECLLILGDNTSALGWLYKTRFFSKESYYYKAVNMIARKIARLVINSPHCIASQHLKGDYNIVADLLSYAETRDDAKPHPLAADGPDDLTLTNRFHSHLSQFVPKSFTISPLPEKILSFATAVLRTLELSYLQSKNPRMRAETEYGEDGKASVDTWASPLTTSSLIYPNRKKNWSPAPSYPSIVQLDGVSQEGMLESVKRKYFQTLSEMPQAIWLRRFGTVSNQAPFTSKGARGYYSRSKC